VEFLMEETNKQTAKEENAKFHCMQTQATEEIRQSQEVTLENQESIKQTLEALNGSLTRIFQLYKKQDERLDEGDKRFQEIRDFMVKKDTTNGYFEKEIGESKGDILKGHDNRLEISMRVTKLESNYEHIIDLIKEKNTAKSDKKISNRTWMIAGFTCIVGPLIFLLILQLVKTFIWHF